MAKVTKREILSDGTIRYTLDNGRFVDKNKFPSGNWKYLVFQPGGSAMGFAAIVGGGDTLKAALANS